MNVELGGFTCWEMALPIRSGIERLTNSYQGLGKPTYTDVLQKIRKRRSR